MEKINLGWRLSNSSNLQCSHVHSGDYDIGCPDAGSCHWQVIYGAWRFFIGLRSYNMSSLGHVFVFN